MAYDLPLGSTISCMAMTADGRFLAAGALLDWTNWGSAIAVSILDAKTGHLTRTLGGAKRPYGHIHSIRFSKDGKLLAIASDNHGDNYDDIDVCETASGRVLTQIRPPPSNFDVEDMAFSADRASMWVAWSDKVDVWDLKTGKVGRSFVPLTQPHVKGAWFARALFSPDAQRLFTSEGNAVVVWDVATGKSISSVRLPGHKKGRYLGLSPDVRLLAAAEVLYAGDWGTGGIELCSIAPNGEIRVVAHDSGQARETAKTGDGRVISFAFTPDNKRLITGMDSGTALVWNVPAAAEKTKTDDQPGKISSTAADAHEHADTGEKAKETGKPPAFSSTPDHTEYWPLSLKEALRLAIRNSKAMRQAGATVQLVASKSGGTPSAGRKPPCRRTTAGCLSHAATRTSV